MRFLVDTNILSDLVRRPHGPIADRIKRVGEQRVCTSIIVAAELRYGAAKKSSSRLKTQLETVLSGRAKRLEPAGQTIRANDLLIAANALTLDLRIENWLR
jgi:tRNA(fMet)-specific endonuclease VapC